MYLEPQDEVQGDISIAQWVGNFFSKPTAEDARQWLQFVLSLNCPLAMKIQSKGREIVLNPRKQRWAPSSKLGVQKETADSQRDGEGWGRSESVWKQMTVRMVQLVSRMEPCFSSLNCAVHSALGLFEATWCKDFLRSQWTSSLVQNK